MTRDEIIFYSIVSLVAIGILFFAASRAYNVFGPKKWYCQKSATALCQFLPQKLFSSGGFDSQQQCESSPQCALPSGQNYYCTLPAKNQCSILSTAPPSGVPPFSTHQACVDAQSCQVEKYYCMGGECIESNTGSGTGYSTLQDCKNACSSPPPTQYYCAQPGITVTSSPFQGAPAYNSTQAALAAPQCQVPKKKYDLFYKFAPATTNTKCYPYDNAPYPNATGYATVQSCESLQ